HIAAGANAVQLFDSWVGSLTPHDFREYVLPTITRMFKELSSYTQPKSYYTGVSSGELLSSLVHTERDVIGRDWRVEVSESRVRMHERFAIQGNLDPMVLTAPMSVIEQQAKRIIDQGMEKPGYIFNLGHGLFPEASIEKVQQLTSFVHEYSHKVL